jgi:hypothetical protein
VDEELAPLILALWQAGIDTHMSCQENFPGITWIHFPTSEDAEGFLDLVAVYPEGRRIRRTLYDRIAGCGSDKDWQYDLHPHDWGVKEDVVGDEVVETCIGPTDFGFSVCIRFPKTDLPLITKRVRRAL